MGHYEPTTGKSDEWYTPAYIFEALAVTFDLDVAHPGTVDVCVPAGAFFTDHALARKWWGFVWMNPPFGGRNGLVPWLERFVEHGNGIALVPDRTSAPWFMDAWRKVDAVMFLPKVKFIQPGGIIGKQPSNGTALLGIGPRAIDAFNNANHAGLGILAYPAKEPRP